MEQLDINITAVLVAVIANFILGFLWYTPLFGKAWAKEMGIDMTRKPTGGEMAKGMSFMLVGNFFMAYVFAHNNAAWSFVPDAKDMSPVLTINATFFTWLGFYLPVDLSRVAWEKASWKLFGINTGYHFMALLVAATILTLM
jgi:hypothetical protein